MCLIHDINNVGSFLIYENNNQCLMLQIGLIDADLIDNGTRHPNLALMKISAFCKLNGNVELLYGEKLTDLSKYDLIVVSKVFNYTKLPDNVSKLLDEDNLNQYNTSIIEAIKSAKQSKDIIISIGGTGFFELGGRNLDNEIEHIMPDYSLYEEFIEARLKQGYKDSFDDYVNYSIGFTTRGCFRKCSFCVNRKYDKSFLNSPVSEFLDNSRPRLYLWDDNFLSYGPGWESILNDLNMSGKPFQFRQGLDIRLISHKKAKILSKSNYYGDYIFAFDHIEEKDLIIKHLIIWRKYCKQTTKLYVLCGYLPTHHEISNPDIDYELQDIIDTFERIRILQLFGCLPYIMRYEDYTKSRYSNLYVQIARWCNQPQFFKKKSFREFCEANQYYTKSTKECTSYKTMKQFELENPSIAAKYFDLKFETSNEYDLSYNYGRIKSEPCKNCRISMITWDMTIDTDPLGWLSNYLDWTLDITCLCRDDSICKMKHNLDKISDYVIKSVLKIKLSEMVGLIDRFPITTIDVSLVPQFSNFEDATINILKLLNSGSFSFEEIGAMLRKDDGNSESFKKYGENHSKLSTLLDLSTITESNGKKIVSITPIGKQLLKYDEKTVDLFCRKQILRIPVIQQLIIHSRTEHISIEKIISISGAKQSTVKRRASSIKALINLLLETDDQSFVFRLNKIQS